MSKMKYSGRSILLLIAIAAIVIFQSAEFIKKYNLDGSVSTNRTTVDDDDDNDNSIADNAVLTKEVHDNDNKEVEEKIKSLEKELQVAKEETEALKLLTAASEQQKQQQQQQQPASSVFSPNDICYHFPAESQSASRLWQKYIPNILKASINPHMPNEDDSGTITKRHEILTQILTPARMRKSALHLPSFRHATIKNVIHIIQRRIQDPKNNPPLQIAIFGGSVTFGTGCVKKGPGKACAWPNRFELLINQFLQGLGLDMDVIKVHNLAIGGTSSETSTNFVKYWMYPPDLKLNGPDVIINAYSTNDSTPSWQLKPEDDWITTTDRTIRKYFEPLIREALQSRACAIQPLLITVDDYLGPQQKSLRGELQLNSVMTQFAKWYDIFAISYAEVVRDVVYQDINDSTFFNKNDVHYGPWAHQTIAWSVGFASLELLQNYCDDEYNERTAAQVLSTTEAAIANSAYGNITAVIDASKNTNDTDTLLKDNIKKYKLFLPPPITRDIELLNATAEFDNAVNDAHQKYLESNCAEQNQEDDKSPCIVNWMSLVGGFGPSELGNFVNKYSIENNLWQVEHNLAEGWGNKVGLTPRVPNATITFQFEKIEKDVRKFTMYFMRSYGEKWKDSLIKMTVSRIKDVATAVADKEEEVMVERMISGIHEDVNYTLSLTTPEDMVFEEPMLKGETIKVKVDFVSGTTFKIMGMFLCNK